MEKTNPEILSLIAPDGQRIAASWFAPLGTPNGKCCLIGPAMSVPRRFYDDFARFLAGDGFAVLSIDFRGFGDSAKEPLIFNEGFASFGHDVSAAVEFAKARANNLVFAGHSLGGQSLGFSEANSEISRAIKVASGTGYYGWSPFPQNALRFIFWTTFFPAATRIAGYYPGKTLGVLGDIPKPIALRWASLCLNPGYFKPGVQAPPPPFFDQFKAPLLSVSFTDDRIMPKAAIDELAGNFRNAQVMRAHISPADLGQTRIGHFNALKTAREPLWPAFSRWLNGGEWQLRGRPAT